MKKKKKYHIVNKRDKEEVNWAVEDVLDDFGAGELLKIANDFLPIRLFRHARKELTGKDEYLEIKGMADDVVAVKSRGQIGIIPVKTDEGLVACISILAKFSVKPPLQDIEPDKEEFRFILDNDGIKRQVDGQYLLDHFMATEGGRDEIVTYPLYTLPSSGKIMKSSGALDLVQQMALRKLNCDFDFKRLPLLREESLDKDGLLYPPPYTLPFPSLSKMKSHRSQAENIRRTGRVARPAEVIDRERMRGRRSRASKGEADRAVRMLLIAMLQEIVPSAGCTGNYAEKVAILNDVWEQLPQDMRQKRTSWCETDLKNYKRAAFERHSVPRYEALISLITTLCERFGVNSATVVPLLFEVELNLALLIEVVKAVLHGQYMKPFMGLARDGLLPGRQDLLRYLSPALTPEMLAACENVVFVTGTRLERDRDELTRLFRRIRIPAKFAGACASVLITPSKQQSRPGKYNVGNAALENVVSCVLQPDILSTRPTHKWIRSVLRPCGLTEESFLHLKKERFIPHRLSNTSKSRGDVAKLARLLRVDAAAVMAAVIDP